MGIGYKWFGVDVEVVAADPLACEYGKMIEDLGVSAPTMAVPRMAEIEHLVKEFGTASFDVVHCTNALDHSHDPLRGIEQALRVLRGGRPVLLRHTRNEAEKNGYAGLHRWNLDVRGGRLFLWQQPSRGAAEVDVVAVLREKGLLEAAEVRTTDAYYAEVDSEGVGKGDWVEAVLWRRFMA